MWWEWMVKRVFPGNRGGRKKPGRPELKWLDCAEDLKTMVERRWWKRRKFVKNGLSF
jgi:hypothetical protein